MRIDFHSHCFDPKLLPPAYQVALVKAHQARTGSTRPIGPVVDRMRQNMHDPNGTVLREGLESLGLGHTFVIGLDYGFALEDFSAEVHPLAQLAWAVALKAQHPDGFFSYAFGVDPRRSDAAALAKEALAICAEGIKIYPPAGFRPDDPVCNAVYEAVLEADGFVIAHTGRQTYPFDLEKGRVEPYASVQRRYPELRLVLGHAGAPFWGYEAIEVARGHPSTMIEVSGWHKSLEHARERVREFLLRAWEELGPNKVLFGTDLVSGPGITARLPLQRRWVEFYQEVAAQAGIDIAKAEETSYRMLTAAQAARSGKLHAG